MRRPTTVRALEQLGRVRLSPSFFMRDFLYSEIAGIAGLQNIPDDPDLAIAAGTRLCETLLEPIQATFGRIAIRSAYRSPDVNAYGHRRELGCASNAANAAAHIWDRRDAEGHMGATACIIVPWVADRFREHGDWRRLAWWIHDHLPYGTLVFFPKQWAVNVQWHEAPKREITSYAEPRGILTRPGMDGHAGDHGAWYAGFPTLRRAPAPVA